MLFVWLKVELSPSKEIFLICFDESPIKMRKTDFHFTFKAVFILKIFKFCPDFFGHVGKRLDKKAKVDLKFYDVPTWETHNYNTHITQHLKK